MRSFIAPDRGPSGHVTSTLLGSRSQEKLPSTPPSTRNRPARHSRAVAMDAHSASIAHELNQPLAAVVTNVETCLRALRKEPPDIAAVIITTQRAMHAALRATRIVRGTRELLAKRRPQKEVVDLQELVGTVIGLLRCEFDNFGATVSTSFETELQPIADSVQLEQVLVNLLTNALHAMSEIPQPQRQVHIRVDHPDDAHIRLTVRDSGPGIPAAAMERLFEPFFSTKEGGMGLGLTISRMAIEAAGGRLFASNNGDCGTMFECLLPRE